MTLNYENKTKNATQKSYWNFENLHNKRKKYTVAILNNTTLLSMESIEAHIVQSYITLSAFEFGLLILHIVFSTYSIVGGQQMVDIHQVIIFIKAKLFDGGAFDSKIFCLRSMSI